MPGKTSHWSREPLVHFLVLGALLFGISALLGGGDGTTEDVVRVTSADIDWLENTWRRQWRRPPTAQELDGLIQNHVREEILFREALAMGLDRDDTIIRRRLVQKLEFLSEDLASQREPSEDELLSYYRERTADYRDPELRSFTHIYFSVDERGPEARREAMAVLSDLRAMATPPERAPELGDRFMMQYDYPDRSEDEVARHMGKSFARGLFEVAPGAWEGPIESGYGVHLVLVHEVRASRAPSYEEVRDSVREDFMRSRLEEANAAFYGELRSRYEVVIEKPVGAADARESGTDG